MTLRIVTSHIHPPIPLRQFDWVAYLDGREEQTQFYGHGATEERAREDLRMNLEAWDREDLLREAFGGGWEQAREQENVEANFPLDTSPGKV